MAACKNPRCKNEVDNDIRIRGRKKVYCCRACKEQHRNFLQSLSVRAKQQERLLRKRAEEQRQAAERASVRKPIITIIDRWALSPANLRG